MATLEEWQPFINNGIELLQGQNESIANIDNNVNRLLEGLGLSGTEEVSPLDVSNLLALEEEPDTEVVEEVPQEVLLPEYVETGFNNLLTFSYMGIVLLIVLTLATMINLGVNLWLAFSDKWRS